MGIKVVDLKKSFGQPPTEVLKGLTFEIQSHDFVSIVGRSGSGKSTLLYLLSTLDNPTAGQIEIEGFLPQKMNDADLHAFRNKNIGFIFQFHYLLPELTALENVLLPARKLNLHIQKLAQAKELLSIVGLSDKLERLPGQLSGGEQQRVAIARALIMQPLYLFADEPTGNLDSANALTVINLLKKINKEMGTTLVLVTHEPDFAAMANHQIHLVDGQLTAVT